MDDLVKIKWLARLILLVYEYFRLLITAVLMTVLMVEIFKLRAIG